MQPARSKTARTGRLAKVTRACDRCKKRKIKCNSKQPCDFCERAREKCTFQSTYRRGRLPSIPLANELLDADEVPQDDSLIEPNVLFAPPLQTESARMIDDVFQDEVAVSHHAATISNVPAAPSAASVHTTARDTPRSPETSQIGLQGHYIGPSSGLSFLQRVQKRLDQANSFSYPNSIFAFGDAPFQSLDSDSLFCVTLSREDMRRVVDRYFDFAMPTYRFLHRPTVRQWSEEFHDTYGAMHDPQSASAKLALLFMVCAHGLVYIPEKERPGPPDLSARYHQAAENQLNKERGAVRLTSIQARLLQCCYLLTQSRINHCWSLFGTMARLAISVGLNREVRPDNNNKPTDIEVECRRRTFWCSYTLDIYLSTALGRARAFHDDDIDTEFPSSIEDLDSADPLPQTRDRSRFTTMYAAIAHFKLARIISRVLRDLYAIRAVSADRRVLLTERISKDLSKWKVELETFLNPSRGDGSLELPILSRQRNVLNFTYWHAIILTNRPSILSALAVRSQQRARADDEDDVQVEESIQQCLAAAMSTANLIDKITNSRQLFPAFWVTTYFAFTAAIVLYICVILRQENSPDIYTRYLLAANRCRAQISSIAETGSLSERYCLLLEELRIEASQQIISTQSKAVAANNPADRLPAHQQLGTASSITEFSGTDVMGTNHLFDNMPAEPFDYNGWDQFASMLSSGLGNLDAFLSDDPFKF